MTRYLLAHAGAEFMGAIKKSTNKSVDFLSPISNNYAENVSRRIVTKFAPALSKYWVKNYLRSRIKNPIDYDCVVIFDCNIWLENLEEFKSYFKRSKIKIWYWNAIRNIEKLEKVKKSGFDIYTFDSGDSEKFGLIYKKQFHWIRAEQNEEDVEYEAIYIGRAKDRLSEIEQIYKRFADKNLKTFFYVVRDQKEQFSSVLPLSNHFMPYDQVISLTRKSKIIIDINAKNQSGMSLRPLEAFAMKKKLITNSEECHAFYKKSNENILDLHEALSDEHEFNLFIQREFNPSMNPDSSLFHFDEWLKGMCE